MKDFFDIWLLSRQFAFEGTMLAAAIAKTFSRRKTTLDLPPFAFTEAFSSDSQKLAQWAGFLRTSRLSPQAEALPQVTAAIESFLLPPAEAARNGGTFAANWTPPGPWIFQ